MFFFFDFNENSNEVPSFEQMMQPILAALLEKGGKASIEDIDALAIELMKLPPKIKDIMHKDSTNRTEVSYRLAWARTYLKKYGLIKNEERGIWSLTDKFDGKIDNINPAEIARKVRNENKESNGECKDDSEYLTGLESVQAFEKMIISLLRELASSQNKQVNTEHTNRADIGIDLTLPQGIDDYEYSLDCIIKYMSSQNQNFLSYINGIADKLKNDHDNKKVLLVLNISISKEDRDNISDKIIIWDKKDLIKKIDPEADYIQYLINPKQTLIRDVVTSEVSIKEKDKERQSYIENVKKAFRNDDMILFLGAGISQDGGIPIWSTLIKRLHICMINRLTEKDKLSFEAQKMISEIATNNEMESPLLQMRYIKSAFTTDQYYKLVRSVLYDGMVDIDTKLLNSIAKICAPQRAHCGIKSIITYNFDDLLERKFAQRDISYNTISCEEDRQLLNKLNIHHVHGFLPKDIYLNVCEPNLIFSEEDYHKVYRDAYSWSNLAQLNALREYTCLFIGCSLTDPNLRRLLDVASRNGEKPRHYAFMKKNQLKDSKNITKEDRNILGIYERIDDNIQTGYYSNLGINIIWIDDYDEIPKILNSILE